MTVFVTQETHALFRDAERFGPLVFLTADDLTDNGDSPNNMAIACKAARLLDDFDPRRDWILPVGSPYVIALVYATLGRENYERIPTLRWDNRDMKYRPMQICLP